MKTATNWCAYTPVDDLGAIAIAGPSRDEALNNYRIALHDHLAMMQECGTTPPSIEDA
jgi:hypothetical protein